MKYKLKSLKKLRRWQQIIVNNNLYYLINGSRVLICDKDLNQLDEIKIKYTADLKIIKNFIFIDTTPGKVYLYNIKSKHISGYKKMQREGFSCFIDSDNIFYKLDWSGNLTGYKSSKMDTYNIFINDDLKVGRIFKVKDDQYYAVGQRKIIIFDKNFKIEKNIDAGFCIEYAAIDSTTSTIYIVGLKIGSLNNHIYCYNEDKLNFLCEIENTSVLNEFYILNNKWMALMFGNKLEIYSINNWELLMEHEFEHIASPIRVEMDGNLLLLSLCYYCEILEIEELDN